MTVDPRFYNEILPRLWRGGKYVYFWTNDDGEGQGYSVTVWHTLDGGKMPKLPSKWVRDLNCYFGIHPSKVRKDGYHRAKIVDIEVINCLYSEVDGLDTPEAVDNWLEWLMETCPKRPSLIIWSGGGLHVYWLLKEPFYLDSEDACARAILAQRAIVSYLGGDISVNDIARVFRVPGSKNLKPERAGAVVTVRHWEEDDEYTLEDLEEMIEEQRTKILAAKAEHLDMAHSDNEDGNEASDGEILRRVFHSKNGDLYRQLWDGDLSGIKDEDHSIGDQTLCNALAWATGRRKSQMDRLFRQSSLFREKWEKREDYREQTLTNAVATAQTVYDPSKARDPEATMAGVLAAEEYLAEQAANQNGNAQANPQGAPSPPPQNNAAANPQRAQTNSSYPYFVSKGRIYVEGEDAKGNAWEKIVADFTARITQEITTEGGERIFEIEGEGKRGGKYAVQIPAETIGKSRDLAAIIEGAVGALDTVRANMSGHVGPSIKLLSKETELKRIRRYQRTGWNGDKFLIPGREPPNAEILLHSKLVYDMGGTYDEQLATDALTSFIEVSGAERSIIMLSHLLTAPLAKIAGWNNERYILMVRGESGSFKTSVTQVGMCIYGAEYHEDSNLLKLGEGVTKNALVSIATQACDMPLFIDNYKPNTDAQGSFVSMIHNILEGGEKERLNRNAQLRETKPLKCWPVITGEDVPETDAAALARVLILHFDSSVRNNGRILSDAQRLSMHLPHIGASWLTWLETDGKAIIAPIAAELPMVRSKWAALLNSMQPEMVNPLRVATNLAINELAYRIACHHPQWGNILAPYAAQHIAGLMVVAQTMAGSTVETAEVNRFLSSVRDLVASGSALLPDKGASLTNIDRGRVLGWRETDGSVYILPKVAMAFAEKQLGVKFNSTTQIANQMHERKMLQSQDQKRRTRKLRLGSTTSDVWHITKIAFEG